VGCFSVSISGKITLSDYFEPRDYVGMDAADKDLGSGGVALLDPTVFNGVGISRMAVSVGKNGKV
jgi:iron transport multicopper oxidase